MEAFTVFKRHVQQIHDAAGVIIAKKQMDRPKWPELIAREEGEGFKVEFSQPAILWNTPLRGSSRSSARRAILMDGSFNFKDAVFESGSACLEVYEIKAAGGKCELTLLEAMHFDIEPDAAFQSPFHPMFHVQFGKNNRWSLHELVERVAALNRMEVGDVTINRDIAMPIRDVRIPTPQMDYLSMLVMVVADYFCEKKDRHDVKAGFKNLINKVMDQNNIARFGRQSKTLEQRWVQAEKPFAAGHWYQESCN